jgi:hypothetical protein
VTRDSAGLTAGLTSPTGTQSAARLAGPRSARLRQAGFKISTVTVTSESRVTDSAPAGATTAFCRCSARTPPVFILHLARPLGGAASRAGA